MHFLNWLSTLKAVLWLIDRWPWLRRKVAKVWARFDDTDEAGA